MAMIDIDAYRKKTADFAKKTYVCQLKEFEADYDYETLHADSYSSSQQRR